MTTKTVKLREILEVQNGFAFKKEFFNEADGLPLIRIRDLGTDSTQTHYSGEYRDEFIVAPGDYLIGMDGNFRCRRWSGPKALLNQRVCRLRNFVPGVLPEYLFFGIQPKLDAIEASTAFATVKHISAKQILDIEFPLPPLSEQHRIVDLLSRAEGIVRLCHEAEKKAATLIPALFLDMFGDPATNPKKWPVLNLGDIVALMRNGTTLEQNQDQKGYPVSRIETIASGSINPLRVRHVDIGDAEKTKWRLQQGDILISHINSVEHIGKSAIYEGTPETLIHGMNLLLIRPDHKKVNSTYLHAALNTSNTRDYIRSRCKRAVNQASINQTELAGIRLFLPDVSMQAQFAQRISEIKSIQTQQSAASAKAQATFDALLAAVF